MTILDPSGQQPPQQVAPPDPPAPIVVQMPPAPSEQKPVTAEDIRAMIMREKEEARREEKEKLYPQIDELKAQLSELTREREERLAAEAAAQAAAEEEERRRIEAEMSAKELIERQKAAFDQQIAELQADRDRERAMREKEAEFARLANYRMQRLQQEEQNIAPQLRDLVSGNTEEEIEASIERMKQKTAEIVAELQRADLSRRQSVPMPPTAGPSLDPSAMTGEGSTRSFSADDIRNMSPAEYGQMRSQLLDAARQRGAYGG